MMTKVKIKKSVFTVLVLITLILTTTAFVAVRKAVFPKPSGSYSVGSFQLELLDTSRITAEETAGRKLLVQFYYPAKTGRELKIPYTPDPDQLESDLHNLYGVPRPLLRKITGGSVSVQLNAAPVGAGRRFPLLIFSHGYNGSRFQNSFLLPELASQGYIVASIEHTNAASGTVFADGSVGRTTPFDSLMFNESFSKKEIVRWSLDQRFVLDRIEALYAAGQLTFGEILDMGRVGVFGHSFGGATSAATLTQDLRFAAGINLDGFYFGEFYKVGFEQPFMELRSDNKSPEEMSEKDLKEWKFTREQYRSFVFDDWKRRLESYARNGHESHTIRYATHMDFSDFSLMMPLAFLTAPHREEHHALTTHLVLDFFNRHLKNTEPVDLPEDLESYVK